MKAQLVPILRRDGAARVARCVIVGVVLVAAGGCEVYERQPLDLPAHKAAFLARTPESPEVAALSRRLRAASGERAAAFDVGDGVHLEEAEAVAMVFNADLRVARLRAGVTAAGAAHAGLWEDPTIGVDLTRIIQSVQHPWKVMSSIGLTIPISGRLEIEKQRTGAEHAVELARANGEEWRVRMELRRAWAEWTALDVQRTATVEFLERVGQVMSLVDRMEQAGEMARSEARLFQIERASRAAEQVMLEARLSEARLVIVQLMGLSPAVPVGLVAAGIGGADGGRAGTGGSEGNAVDLEARSPRMLVAAGEYEAAEKALELEIRKQYPDLTIGPGYGLEDGDDEVLLGLSVPVPILNGNRGGITEARARREVARASAQMTLERLLSDAYAAKERLAAATRQRELMEREIVPLVDAQYADARQVAQLGEVNTLVLLESLTRQHDAKIRLIESYREEALARIRVIELTGPEPSPAGAAGPTTLGRKEGTP